MVKGERERAREEWKRNKNQYIGDMQQFQALWVRFLFKSRVINLFLKIKFSTIDI